MGIVIHSGIHKKWLISERFHRNSQIIGSIRVSTRVVEKGSVCDRSDQNLGFEAQGPLTFEYHFPPTTIQHFIWWLWQPLLQAVPLDTLEDRMQNAVGQVDPPRRDPKSPMPHNVTLAKPHNKEKSYIQKISRDSVLWPMAKTPRNYAKQSTRTSEGIRTLASSQQTQT